MLAYETLIRYPGAFRSFAGMTPDEFDNLLATFTAAQARRQRSRRTTRQGQPRQRAAGAGHPHRHDDRHRLLMALVWLRVYPTYELLGFFFGLHKRNAQLNVRDALVVLLRSPATNSPGVFGEPLAHPVVGPRPAEGVSVPPVVLRP